jgi:DNA-binding Lrp family transcriptional regulator
MKEKILKAINKNSKLSTEDLSKMLGTSEAEVAAIIKELEDEKVICGYPTLINWEKVENEEKVSE